MLKLIVSGTFTLALADRIACRSDPTPLSFTLVTTKVAARTCCTPIVHNKSPNAIVRQIGQFQTVVSECQKQEKI